MMSKFQVLSVRENKWIEGDRINIDGQPIELKLFVTTIPLLFENENYTIYVYYHDTGVPVFVKELKRK